MSFIPLITSRKDAILRADVPPHQEHPMPVFTALVSWLVGTMVPLALAAGCLWTIFEKIIPKMSELSMHQTSGEEIYFGLLYATGALGLAFVALVLGTYALVRNWRMWK